ncbi:MAG: hypothetical protein RH942_09210 [Kiloniellaceae bacterium]
MVTLLLEVFIRWLGLKRQGQVELIGRLLDATVAPHLPDQKARWKAICTILQNPFSATEMAADAAAQTYKGRSAGGIYTEVSLEHVLRRLLESDAATTLLQQAEQDLKDQLQALGNKFDEYSAALAANFKRSTQMWSIFVGIGLALVTNFDGPRLLQSYLQDPELRKSVIENLPSAPDTEAPGAAGQGNVDSYVADLKTSLAGIGDLALPIGLEYFPHCHLPLTAAGTRGTVDPLCRADAGWETLPALLTWLMKVIVTGMLVGLGAPFWYDVARRLAAVRSAFGGRPAGEERHRGADANEPKARERLIERVIKEAKTAASQTSGTSPV